MAKKVRKDGERKEEKRAVFEPPEFDEREWLTEQLRNIRMNMVFIFYAIPFGLLGAHAGNAWGSTLTGFGMAILGFIAGFYFILPIMGVALEEMPKRQIAGSAAMFILSFIAFSILFSSPPLYDETDPAITSFIVLSQGDAPFDSDWDVVMVEKGWLPPTKVNDQRTKDSSSRYYMFDENDPPLQGETLKVLVRAADASGLEGVTIEHWYGTPSGIRSNMTPVAASDWRTFAEAIESSYLRFRLVPPVDLESEIWAEHYFEFTIENVTVGDLYFRVVVEDKQGRQVTVETDNDEALTIAEPFISSLMFYVDVDQPLGDDWAVLTVHRDWLPPTDGNKERISKRPYQQYYLWKQKVKPEPGNNVKVLVRVESDVDLRSVQLKYWYRTYNPDTKKDMDGPLQGPVSMQRVSKTDWETYKDVLEGAWSDKGLIMPEELPYEGWGDGYWQANLTSLSEGDLYIVVTAQNIMGGSRSYTTAELDALHVVVPD